MQTDITFGPFDVPIINSRAYSALKYLDGSAIQFIPVSVKGIDDNYWIANLLIKSDILDEVQSKIMWWKPEDGRPDKLGEYRMVSKAVARLDVEIPSLSRLKKFDISVVVNENTKQTISEYELTGIDFEKI